jgi:hypothetical protein
VFRLRANPATNVSPYYLLAALSTEFVKRQVRARQFSADIIDKIGNRHLGILVPIHRNPKLLDQVAREVKAIVAEQDLVRAEITTTTDMQMKMTRERARTHLGFSVRRQELRRRVLLPKYYDPDVEAAIRVCETQQENSWVAIGDLVDSGALVMNTGVEVGKMAYGTGDVPFIRTSDIADLEIKRDVRQGVSEAVYLEHQEKAGVHAGDIVVVRDGTYLVGSSALMTDADEAALICGGLFRVRVTSPDLIPSAGLLAALNHPAVRRQMRARQFTRDVIDTLGDRLLEVRIPDPKSQWFRAAAMNLSGLLVRKTSNKERIRAVVAKIEPQAGGGLSGRPGWSMR